MNEKPCHFYYTQLKNAFTQPQYLPLLIRQISLRKGRKKNLLGGKEGAGGDGRNFPPVLPMHHINQNEDEHNKECVVET